MKRDPYAEVSARIIAELPFLVATISYNTDHKLD
jgi:hypothetical protein